MGKIVRNGIHAGEVEKESRDEEQKKNMWINSN